VSRTTVSRLGKFAFVEAYAKGADEIITTHRFCAFAENINYIRENTSLHVA
jgi:hypothetical protein